METELCDLILGLGSIMETLLGVLTKQKSCSDFEQDKEVLKDRAFPVRQCFSRLKRWQIWNELCIVTLLQVLHSSAAVTTNPAICFGTIFSALQKTYRNIVTDV